MTLTWISFLSSRTYRTLGICMLIGGASACTTALYKRESFRDHCCSSPEATKLYNQANDLSKAGDKLQARGLYEQALRLEPSYLCAKVNLGLLYWKEKRTAEALTLLQEVSKTDPQDVLLHDNLGDIHREMGDFAQAESEYLQVIALDPSRHRSLYDLAGAQKDQKKYAEAAKNYESYIKLASDSPKEAKRVAYAHTYLAWYLKRPAPSSQAKKVFDEMMSGKTPNPDQVDSYHQVIPSGQDSRKCKDGHALILLVDKSGSVRSDSLLSQEKEIILQTIPKLPSSIFLGLIAFDSAPFLIFPLEKLDENTRAHIPDRMKKLVSYGKTELLPALNFSRTQLEKHPTLCKSVILFSDAKFPVNIEMLKPELDSYRAKDIRLSTLMLGADGDAPLMKLLSKAGQGTFVQVFGKPDNDLILTSILSAMGVIPAVEKKASKGK